jgi:hypothetical protein
MRLVSERTWEQGQTPVAEPESVALMRTCQRVRLGAVLDEGDANGRVNDCETLRYARCASHHKRADRRYGWTLWPAEKCVVVSATIRVREPVREVPPGLVGRARMPCSRGGDGWAESVCKADSVSHAFVSCALKAVRPRQGSSACLVERVMNIRISESPRRSR